MWLRGAINQHVKISEIDQIFVIDNGDILVNTIIFAAKEVVYTKRMTNPFTSLKAFICPNEIGRVLVSPSK